MAVWIPEPNAAWSLRHAPSSEEFSVGRLPPGFSILSLSLYQKNPFWKRRREKLHCGLNFDGDVSRSLLPTWKGGQWPTKKKKTVSHKKQNTKKQTNKHSYGLYKDHSAKFSHSIVSPFWFGWFTYSISLNGCSDAMTMCSTCRSKGNSTYPSHRRIDHGSLALHWLCLASYQLRGTFQPKWSSGHTDCGIEAVASTLVAIHHGVQNNPCCSFHPAATCLHFGCQPKLDHPIPEILQNRT